MPAVIAEHARWAALWRRPRGAGSCEHADVDLRTASLCVRNSTRCWQSRGPAWTPRSRIVWKSRAQFDGGWWMWRAHIDLCILPARCSCTNWPWYYVQGSICAFVAPPICNHSANPVE